MHFAYHLHLAPGLGGDELAAKAPILERHYAYLSDLCDRGVVTLAGRAEDTSFGIVIFEADSIEEATGIVEGDPAVAEHVMTAELKEFRLALLKSG